jgi:hypothetical protein
MEMKFFLLNEVTSCRHNFWLGKAWQQSIKGKEHFQEKSHRRSGITPCPEDFLIITKKTCQGKFL